MRMCENDMGIKYDTKHNTNANVFQFDLFIWFSFISCKSKKKTLKNLTIISYIRLYRVKYVAIGFGPIIIGH